MDGTGGTYRFVNDGTMWGPTIDKEGILVQRKQSKPLTPPPLPRPNKGGKSNRRKSNRRKSNRRR
jgi:hypothetical protein